MLDFSKNGISLLEGHEGREKRRSDGRLYVYICPAGHPTIGVGHKCSKAEVEKFRDGITDEQADALLRSDISGAAKAVERLVNVDINQNQIDALISFTFNLGAGNLQSSTLLKKLNKSDFDGAANEFGKWVYGTNPKTKRKERMPGLIRRRKDERELFERPIE